MAEENIDKKATSAYEQLSEIHPPRVVESIKDDGDSVAIADENAGSLGRRMKQSPKLTDFQVIDKRLFPILKEGVEWLNNLMVARIFPETQIPLKIILGKHLLTEYPEMQLAEAICIAEVAVSVALDSEGRIDIYKAYVGGHEATEQEDKNKNI